MGDISVFVVNSIFRGPIILIPCLFIVYKLGLKIYEVNESILIRTVNCVLLFGSVVYLVLFLFDTFMSVFSLGAYEHDHYSNPDFGRYGWLRWIFMIMPYGLLPQLLWIKKFRHSLTSSFIIITAWGLLTLLTIIVVFYFVWTDYLEQIAVYFICITLIYLVLNRRRNRAALTLNIILRN